MITCIMLNQNGNNRPNDTTSDMSLCQLLTHGCAILRHISDINIIIIILLDSFVEKKEE